jgi:mannitol/fructose-specific phosphotransferase system IIA component (Ntr-type)
MKRTSLIGLILGLVVWSFAACRCSKDVEKPKPAEVATVEYKSTVSKLPKANQVDLAAVIPSDSAAVMVGADLSKLLEWLESREWVKAVIKTSAYRDIYTTSSMLNVSTLQHKLKALSAVSLKKPKLKELFSTPTAIALRIFKKRYEYLMIKQVDLKVQALDRLVEVFNQVSPQAKMITSRNVEGMTLRKLKLSQERSLFYVIFSNLMILSNSEGYLLEAFKLAQGKSSNSLAMDEQLKKQLSQELNKYDLVGTLYPGRLWTKREMTWLSSLMPAERWVFQLTSGTQPKLQLTAKLKKDAARQEHNAAYLAQKIVPLDSRAIWGISKPDWFELFGQIVEERFERTIRRQTKINFKRELFENIKGQTSVVFGGVDVSKDHPFFHLALIVKTSNQSQVEKTMSKLFSYLFPGKPEKIVYQEISNRSIFAVADDNVISPAFAVVDGWLVVTTSVKMMEEILKAAEGQKPTIEDLPGFSKKIVAAAKPFYMFNYFDCQLLFEDLKTYVQHLMKKSDQYDPSTVEQTISPLLDSLKKMGKLGGAISQQGAQLSGEVVPL